MPRLIHCDILRFGPDRLTLNCNSFDISSRLGYLYPSGELLILLDNNGLKYYIHPLEARHHFLNADISKYMSTGVVYLPWGDGSIAWTEEAFS